MTKKEIDIILSDSYSWIKVKNYNSVVVIDAEIYEDLDMYWMHSYKDLLQHHTKETTFLINKCKELAKHIKNNNILI